MSHNVADETGVRVMAERCSTCIFRPGNLMHLQPGRLRDMLREVRRKEGCIPCHETLTDEKQAVCRGQFDVLKTQALQVAERLGCIDYYTREATMNGKGTDVNEINAPWSGTFTAYAVNDADKTMPSADGVAEVVGFATRGDRWDGMEFVVVRLKDGRYMAWEAMYGPTGDAFHEDAYGGEGDVWFADATDLSRLLNLALSDAGREALGLPREGV